MGCHIHSFVPEKRRYFGFSTIHKPEPTFLGIKPKPIPKYLIYYRFIFVKKDSAHKKRSHHTKNALTTQNDEGVIVNLLFCVLTTSFLKFQNF